MEDSGIARFWRIRTLHESWRIRLIMTGGFCCFGGFACGCARNRSQETNVLIVSVLFAVVVNLALRSNAQGRIEVVGMRKLTILVELGAFPVTIMGDLRSKTRFRAPAASWR